MPPVRRLQGLRVKAARRPARAERRGSRRVARALIIACGCRGLALAGELRAVGHAVRGSTREPARAAVLERAGVEPVLGDPDRVATLARGLEHVTLAYVLLGCAVGEPARLEALHTTRLDMLLSKMLDSTVRAIVYEAAGTVAAPVLAGGAARVRAFCEDSRVPCVLLRTPGAEHEAWLAEASGAAGVALG